MSETPLPSREEVTAALSRDIFGWAYCLDSLGAAYVSRRLVSTLEACRDG